MEIVGTGRDRGSSASENPKGGEPGVILKHITDYDKIYIACGATDLRRSVDGLCNIIRNDFKLDPFENCLFLFCNRNRNRMKGLSWDKNGFCLCYKRLDGTGAKFIWPRDEDKPRKVDIGQLNNLMEGMSIDPPKGFGEISARNF